MYVSLVCLWLSVHVRLKHKDSHTPVLTCSICTCLSQRQEQEGSQQQGTCAADVAGSQQAWHIAEDVGKLTVVCQHKVGGSVKQAVKSTRAWQEADLFELRREISACSGRGKRFQVSLACFDAQLQTAQSPIQQTTLHRTVKSSCASNLANTCACCSTPSNGN